MPFWGLLEQLESSRPPIIAIRNSVGAVACVPSLRTPVGKARGWIRQSLNTHCLEETIMTLTKNEKLVKFFYSGQSIVSTPEDTTILVWRRYTI